MDRPFWERKPLSLLNQAEWESLCDGCARCCLVKLEDIDTGDIYFTQVACQFLDLDSCRCSVYAERTQRAPDCLRLHKLNLPALRTSLPPTCAYRRLLEGKQLPSWHPLLSGRADSVSEAGLRVSSFACSELDLDADAELEDYVIDLAGDESGSV